MNELVGLIGQSVRLQHRQEYIIKTDFKKYCDEISGLLSSGYFYRISNCKVIRQSTLHHRTNYLE
jgi:hypothetical protein